MNRIVLVGILLSFLVGCATQNALHSAIQKDKDQKVEKLVLEKDVNPFVKNEAGVSAFDLIVEKNGIENLPSWAADLYERSHVRSVDLYNRIAMGILDVEGFKLELEKANFYLEAPNLKGDTLLSAIVRAGGSIGYIQALIDAGASVNTLNDEKQTPLFNSVVLQDTEVVKLLLDSGANPNQIGRNLFPLTMAVYFGDKAITELLLQSGANVNNTTNTDIGVLFLVASKAEKRNSENDLELIEMLFNAGADLNITDVDDNTPLISSINNNRPEIRDFLINNGADLNKPNKDKATPLIRAALKNDLESIKALISAGADLNSQDSDGWTVIHYAIHNNQEELATFLIEADADLERASDDGWTPLVRAIFNGKKILAKKLLDNGANPDANDDIGRRSSLHFTASHPFNGVREHDVEIIQLLLEKNADINSVNEDGNTPLNSAILNSRLNVVKTLLTYSSVDVNKADKKGWTPLINAVYDGDVNVVKALIEAGADLNLKSNSGWTALNYATNKKENGIRVHDKQIAELLLQAKANANLVDKNNYTPVALAVANDRLEVLNMLIKYKANLNIPKNEGVTPLMEAVFDGNVAAVKALVNGGANINLQKDTGWSALHYSANTLGSGDRKHDAEIAKILLAKKPNLNLKTTSGYTALHLSIENNRPEVRKVLLANKANPNTQRASDQWTPLMVAVYKGDIQAVKDLIKAGANLNARESDGWTALHFTANGYNNGDRTKDAEIARLLIEAKANLEITNHQGRTPFATALDNNRTTVQDVLLRHGAEDTRYPARPQARPGVTTCNTRCNNGDCYRTYSDGRKLRFQAQQRYNALSGNWEYDSGSC